ncbi:apolipoprotein A-II [Antennarius striatus]|uniref:apolipoprotein A-II n=1 Tax=Antennarius striatus TaxID=241820 RepID=UPI0035B0CBDF
MNAKYAVALLLVFQVSMSLCDVPTPSTELLEKYERIRDDIMKKLMSGLRLLENKTAPVVEMMTSDSDVQTLTSSVGDLPEVKKFTQTYNAVKTEIKKFAAKVRNVALSIYERRFRPTIGEQFSNGIDKAKEFVDALYVPEGEHA